MTTQDVTVQPPMPEPSTYLLMGMRLFGVLAAARRRQRRERGSVRRAAFA
ncbi:MAG: PEP-CTERM sorting domain-containing protein [Pseudomonadota bacterium]|nr:PEP-CTERM sorting domain-containing protein [Pseudomonadota bacterium]